MSCHADRAPVSGPPDCSAAPGRQHSLPGIPVSLASTCSPSTLTCQPGVELHFLYVELFILCLV
jgi:hypothetical protein